MSRNTVLFAVLDQQKTPVLQNSSYSDAMNFIDGRFVKSVDGAKVVYCNNVSKSQAISGNYDLLTNIPARRNSFNKGLSYEQVEITSSKGMTVFYIMLQSAYSPDFEPEAIPPVSSMLVGTKKLTPAAPAESTAAAQAVANEQATPEVTSNEVDFIGLDTPSDEVAAVLEAAEIDEDENPDPTPKEQALLSDPSKRTIANLAAIELLAAKLSAKANRFLEAKKQADINLASLFRMNVLGDMAVHNAAKEESAKSARFNQLYLRADRWASEANKVLNDLKQAAAESEQSSTLAESTAAPEVTSNEVDFIGLDTPSDVVDAVLEAAADDIDNSPEPEPVEQALINDALAAPQAADLEALEALRIKLNEKASELQTARIDVSGDMVSIRSQIKWGGLGTSIETLKADLEKAKQYDQQLKAGLATAQAWAKKANNALTLARREQAEQPAEQGATNEATPNQPMAAAESEHMEQHSAIPHNASHIVVSASDESFSAEFEGKQTAPIDAMATDFEALLSELESKITHIVDVFNNGGYEATQAHSVQPSEQAPVQDVAIAGIALQPVAPQQAYQDHTAPMDDIQVATGDIDATNGVDKDHVDLVTSIVDKATAAAQADVIEQPLDQPTELGPEPAPLICPMQSQINAQAQDQAAECGYIDSLLCKETNALISLNSPNVICPFTEAENVALKDMLIAFDSFIKRVLAQDEAACAGDSLIARAYTAVKGGLTSVLGEERASKITSSLGLQDGKAAVATVSSELDSLLTSL